MKIELIVAIFGLIGVVVGSLCSIFGQILLNFLQEKKNGKKHLRKNMLNFLEKIHIIKNTISSLINITTFDLKDLEEYEVDEAIISVNYFLEKYISVLSKFKTFLWVNMPKSVRDKRYEDFEKTLTFIEIEYIGSRVDKFAKPDLEMLIARQEEIKRNHQNLKNAKEYITNIENEFMKIIK